ncbi:MAG: hypothetical protein HOM55_08920 [Proteobacteria bacterium]|nr:hypothetical protein [Pseudomonadota bacterium]
MNRCFCSALLLMLLISHAALSLHVTNYHSADLANCELCTGQANPTYAIPPSTSELLPSETTFKVNTYYVASVVTTAALFSYYTRAPPTLA